MLTTVLSSVSTAEMSAWALFWRAEDEKHDKNRHWYVQLLILEQWLAQWWHPVASSKAQDPFHWAMHTVTYWYIATAIKTASKVGIFFHCCSFACHPGSRRGNMEQVVARWQLPGASSVALDLLNQTMPRALLQRICMVFEMACKGGTFARLLHLFPWHYL